ncbi:4-hydroxy-tetrahydrodipicolinate reductase [bacterium]|nr:MAG: 4-hydroxy-tetrahydrodipicolinate reductase [bacterium]
MSNIRVALAGAGGRMGREALRALVPEHGFEIVAATGRTDAGQNAQDLAGSGAPDLILTSDFEGAPAFDVLVDLSHHSVAANHAELAMRRGASVVIGCTGLSPESLARLEKASGESGKGVLIVPNFSVGAVLMMKFAQMAAAWLPDVEVLELHHERKEDAPSGTAMLTAKLISEARRSAPTPLPKPFLKAEGARGAEVEGVPVHSVRLPGYLAHQAVMFGGPGESLTIRHDSMDRASFMPGVRLAAQRVREMTGVTVGLDKVLF